MALALFLVFVGFSLYMEQAALSLFLGIFLSFINSKLSLIHLSVNGSQLLKAGIVFLGVTISLKELGDISYHYLPIASIYVIVIMIFGLFLGKIINIPRKLSLLLVSATAICGATAIAALAPIINARRQHIVASISLVFLLNAIAIILFPYIGEYFEMTNAEFGIFSALTIHDTASVIGTASLYSDQSVTYASIIKLGRTIWIMPILICASIYSKSENKDYDFPYFIIVFILFVILGNFLGIDGEIKSMMKRASIAFFQIGLFMVGYSFRLKTISEIYPLKAIIFSVSMWIVIVISTILIFHV